MNSDQLQAVRIVERVFGELPLFVKPGMKERDVARTIRRLLKDHGAQKESFRIITAAGRRTKLVHGFATDRRIRRGDMIMFDFGALYNGWRSDVTRTYVIGKPDKKQKAIWSLLLAAQRAAIKKVRQGQRCDAIDTAARSMIRKAGYGKNFRHSLGHGIGKRVHQAPKIGPRNRNRLKAGQVITIEPGIYIDGWGGMRVEDMVLVTKLGCKVLTKLPKNLKLKC
ncbi:MAG: M24 family metallopeptidase [Candidatus Margulisiibacteriota bacterium]